MPHLLHMLFALALALALSWGCQAPPAPAAPPAPPTPGASGEEEGPATSTPPALQLEATPGAPHLEACVAGCIEANAMRAQAAEAIASDCVNHCERCFSRCVQENLGRAVAPEVIDADCAASCAAEP